MPWVTEVRGDDLEVRKCGRRGVEPDRPGEVDPDPLTARLAGSDAAGPGVKQHDQPQLLAPFVKRPVLLFVRSKGLQRGMQLHALQAHLGDAVELFDSPVALQRVDAAEPDEVLRVFAARLRNEVVWNSGASSRCFRIPRQQDGDDIQRVVLMRQLVDRLACDFRAEI